MSEHSINGISKWKNRGKFISEHAHKILTTGKERETNV